MLLLNLFTSLLLHDALRLCLQVQSLPQRFATLVNSNVL